MKKAPVIITGIVTLLTILFVTVFMQMDEQQEVILLDRFTHLTQDMRGGMSASTVTEEVKKQQEESTPDITPPDTQDPQLPGDTVDMSSWMSVCESIHRAWNANGWPYGYGQARTWNYDNKDRTVRIDCSGYVSACLVLYNCYGDYSNMTDFRKITSGSYASPVGNFQLLSTPQEAGGTTWQDAIKPGDVLFYSGHVEVCHTGGDEYPMVYNWGGTSSVSVPGESKSGHRASQIRAIWRLNN